MHEPTDDEKLSFQIVALVGSARSKYVEAIQKAQEGDLAGAETLMTEGDDLYGQGHEKHLHIISAAAAAAGETSPSIFVVHAEDQMMSAETIRIVAQGFMNAYRTR